MNSTILFGVLAAGFSTGIGALPIFLKKKFSKDQLNLGLGFSAGVMLVASFVSLILPSLDAAKIQFGGHFSLAVVICSILVGSLAIIIVHEFLPHEHIRTGRDMNYKKSYSRVTLIVLAIALHNLPEGLAVGVGFGGGETAQGLALALAISLQNMPEGLVVAFGLLAEGATRQRAFFMALLSGLVEPVAAVLGYYTASFSVYSLPIALAFAGGMMLFVICQEILPELFREGSTKAATGGVVAGILLMLSIDFYF